MAPTTGTFVNKKGQKLVTCCYPAQGKAIANLFWHHGLGEHSGRRGYVELFNKLAGSGIEVHTFDCHGHGKSEPTAPADRAVIWRFEDLVSSKTSVLVMHGIFSYDVLLLFEPQLAA
jgi:acylglycerol lipase